MIKKVTIIATSPLDKYEVSKREGTVYNPFTRKLSFNVNYSISKLNWRLVYWNDKIKDLFESKGITCTINHLFCGTKQECLNEIKKLKLEYNLEEEKQKQDLTKEK